MVYQLVQSVTDINQFVWSQKIHALHNVQCITVQLDWGCTYSLLKPRIGKAPFLAQAHRASASKENWVLKIMTSAGIPAYGVTDR